jgi:hypothetical protein
VPCSTSTIASFAFSKIPDAVVERLRPDELLREDDDLPVREELPFDDLAELFF